MAQFTVTKSYIKKHCKESKIPYRLCRRNNLVSNQTTCLPCPYFRCSGEGMEVYLGSYECIEFNLMYRLMV